MSAAARTAAGVAVAAVFLGGQPAAQAAGTHDYVASGFVHDLRGAAVLAEARPTNRVAAGTGYSAVDLSKSATGTYGRCEAIGAGALVDQRRLLESNGPPDGSNRSGVANPTETWESTTFAKGRQWSGPGGGVRSVTRRVVELEDQVLDASRTHGPWSADCQGDSAGRAAGHHADGLDAGAAGSTTSGAVDRATGAYVGTSRAYATGVRTPAGVVDVVSSTVRIEQRPEQAPVVSYRIAVDGGVLAGGVDVPAGALARQFAEQVRRNAAAVAALPALGLSLTGPTYGEYATRHVVHFPFVEVAAGRDDDGGSAVRLVAVRYEGADLRDASA
jgi:hypothetical protein